MKKFLPEAVVLCAIVLVVHYGFAQTWTQTSANTYGGMGLSADGRIILSVGSTQPVLSTNWGVTWNIPNAFGFGDEIASSADGTRFIAVPLSSGNLYISTNSGNSWMATSSPSKSWTSCASSADGVKLVAAVYLGLIYTSTNSGATWQTNNAPSNYWKLTSSADGSKLAAAANGDKIYTSTNSGLTWAVTSAPTNSWHGIASSSDGSCLIVGSDRGVYTSTNSGFSWKSNILGQAVASSADGSKLIVGYYDSLNHGRIYTSSNSGIDWITNNIPDRKWTGVRSSADGNELLAYAQFNSPNPKSLWIYHATSSPELKLMPLDTNLMLSWPVPSTNFVLQQNLDLTTPNWVTLTNTPVLNLTKLNNELILAPSNSSGFFRLISQ